MRGTVVNVDTWARFLSLARSKLRLCSANHRPGYWSNLPCDWLSTAWAYSKQETENGPWWCNVSRWHGREGINSLAPGRCSCNLKFVICKFTSMIDFVYLLPSGECQMTSLMSTLVQEITCVHSGNKPRPRPMMTKHFNAVWRHQAPGLIYFYHIIL